MTDDENANVFEWADSIAAVATEQNNDQKQNKKMLKPNERNDSVHSSMSICDLINY